MADRARQRALEAYPYNRAYTDNDIEYDGNFCNRKPYIEGYEQAEKDLALTVEDISKIISIDQIVCVEYGISDYVNKHGKAMEEVLKRYNESKK